MKKIETIAIIGLGLMGGSLAARVRKRFPKARVIGISRNPQAVRAALTKRWIQEGGNRLEAARSADLVVLCTPVDTFAKFLLALEKICRPGTLVTDVGSVKREIIEWVARRRFKKIQFTGAHPMAGSHARGIQAARENLFDHSLTFVIRSSASARAFNGVKNFWRKITPRVVEIDAQKHDRVLSDISHLPHALAVCLALTPADENLKFAATGFADTTRVAAGDPSVWLPIFLANRKEILHGLKKFEKTLAGLRRMLAKSERQPLLKLIKKAQARREALRL